jgi:hypothetical protein
VASQATVARRRRRSSTRRAASRSTRPAISTSIYINDGNNNRIRRLNLATPIDVDPDTLNITSSSGQWITAYIQFPAGWDAANVNVGSVRIQAINPADGALRLSASNQVVEAKRAPNSPIGLVDRNGDGVPELMLKFDRTIVASWATGAPELVLRVQGQFQPPTGSPTGRFFSGDTRIRGVYPPNASPSMSSEETQTCDPQTCCDPDACPAPAP